MCELCRLGKRCGAAIASLLLLVFSISAPQYTRGIRPKEILDGDERDAILEE